MRYAEALIGSSDGLLQVMEAGGDEGGISLSLRFEERLMSRILDHERLREFR